MNWGQIKVAMCLRQTQGRDALRWDLSTGASNNLIFNAPIHPMIMGSGANGSPLTVQSLCATQAPDGLEVQDATRNVCLRTIEVVKFCGESMRRTTTWERSG